MMSTRSVSIVPAGTAFHRLLVALAQKDQHVARALAAEWVDTPQVGKALELRTKAAATVADSSWAGVLASTGIAADALAIARDISVIDAAAPRMRRVPSHVTVPRQTDSGAAGGRVPEGASLVVASGTLDGLVLNPDKFQTAMVGTLDLFRLGPAAESVLRSLSVGALMRRIDALFLDPTDPLSITANGTEVTSTGTTAAQMTADLAAMLAAITTSGAGLVWIMGRKTAARIALALGAAAAGLPVTFLGLPAILSGHADGQITLVDLNEVAFVDEDAFEVFVSTQGTIQLLENPTNNSATATATQLISLWQTNSAAIRTTRWLNWQVIRQGGSPAIQPVAWMTVGY